MREYISKNISDTEEIAATLAFTLNKGDFVALYGEMGAGKTTFVRGLVKALIPECLSLVHSPTFAIVNEYPGEDLTLYHFDFYRIEDEEDLYSTGFYDYPLKESIIITEWSERLEESIPQTAIKVTITADSNGERRISIC